MINAHDNVHLKWDALQQNCLWIRLTLQIYGLLFKILRLKTFHCNLFVRLTAVWLVYIDHVSSFGMFLMFRYSLILHIYY